MDTVKARIQENAPVITIPKSFNVKPGTEYRFTKGKGWNFNPKTSRKVPSTLEELFKDWHGQHQMPDDLKDWQIAKSKGEELW